MPRNIEIKARARDFHAQSALAERLAENGIEHLVQEDTFFDVPTGRLKLRVFGDGSGELIQYERENSAGPKESRYVVAKTDDPETLRQALGNALAVAAIVRKKRAVYRHGQARIHFDQVDGLGAFIEIEVVLKPADDAADGTALAEVLMSGLGIDTQDLIAGAYVDLFHSVRHVHERAFGGPTEAEIVRLLHNANKIKIARAAVKDGHVVGHVVFSDVTIASMPEAARALGLGPVAVLPEYQGKGIGSALIRESIEEAIRLGYAAVVVLGHPGYYRRFGFERAGAFGLANEYGADAKFMVLPLSDPALAGFHGMVTYAPEFRG